ncbi:MAG: hypothetical protein KKG59_06640 [Nanoarchaeota archaeon]|nr:hypothetical protein [Nanoarchaeota archaeon]
MISDLYSDISEKLRNTYSGVLRNVGYAILGLAMIGCAGSNPHVMEVKNINPQAGMIKYSIRTPEGERVGLDRMKHYSELISGFIETKGKGYSHTLFLADWLPEHLDKMDGKEDGVISSKSLDEFFKE